MNKEQLKEKYLRAESTLEEEKILFDSDIEGIQPWGRFVKNQQKKTPANLKEKLWLDELFDTPKRKLPIYQWLPIAASILFIACFAFYFVKAKENDYKTKKELLEEAISLVSQSEQMPPHEDIIYQDNLLIIYKTAE